MSWDKRSGRGISLLLGLTRELSPTIVPSQHSSTEIDYPSKAKTPRYRNSKDPACFSFLTEAHLEVDGLA